MTLPSTEPVARSDLSAASRSDDSPRSHADGAQRPPARVRRRWLRPVLGLVGLVIAWEAVVRIFGIPTFLLPTPSAVAGRFLASPAPMVDHFLVTAFEALVGLGIALLVASVTAVLLTSSQLAEDVVFPYLVILEVTPIVALAPLLIIWLGPGTEAKVAIAAIIAYFPIVVNLTAGLKSATPEALELLRSWAVSGSQEYRYLRVPQSVPYLFAALRIAAPLAVVGAIVGEMVGSDRGLGFVIIRAKGILDTQLLFMGIVASAILGVTLFFAFSVVESRVRRRRTRPG